METIRAPWVGVHHHICRADRLTTTGAPLSESLALFILSNPFCSHLRTCSAVGQQKRTAKSPILFPSSNCLPPCCWEWVGVKSPWARPPTPATAAWVQCRKRARASSLFTPLVPPLKRGTGSRKVVQSMEPLSFPTAKADGHCGPYVAHVLVTLCGVGLGVGPHTTKVLTKSCDCSPLGSNYFYTVTHYNS